MLKLVFFVLTVRSDKYHVDWIGLKKGLLGVLFLSYFCGILKVSINPSLWLATDHSQPQRHELGVHSQSVRLADR